ncbi:hypothetical protein ACFWPH_23575 [Nocardia sp. NPDC058499]|uniref:hypothetical protein n=1 Tax=Nocardia sp. NPDC058499 TaxID=3346530 RepID=UPI00365A93EC
MSLGDAFGLTSTPDFLPRHHGTDGDTRYPSPRDLRSTFAALVDFVLQFGSFFAALAVLLILVAKLGFSPAVGSTAMLIPVVVIVGNRILLPKTVHSSIGELIFGLVEIRGSDGAWPGWRDLLSGHGQGRDGVPNIVAVRRCDVRRT